MSQMPSDPGADNNRRHIVDYDELIALFVAFLTLGSVVFWGLTRSGINLLGDTAFLNGDGALPGEVENGRLLGGADNTDADTQLNFDADGIGFGAAAAVGAAGAGSILGDLGSSAEDAATQIVPPTNRATISPDSTPAASATTPVAPDPIESDPEPAAAVPPTEPVAPPLEVTQEALKFTDVPDGYWAKPYIDALSERDVFDGIIVDGVEQDETFKPDEPISRAQLARAITKAFPLSEDEEAMTFSDVADDFWALEFINEAVKGGYMNGFPDDTFKPELPVPRTQALTAMVTGSNATVQGDAADVVTRYGDAADIQNWAIPKIAAATQQNLVVNHPDLDTLNPNRPATRAEVAAMIYQTLVAQGRIEPIEGEYIVKP